MSNFQCTHCGMTNIDCGKDGYKTPKEIKYEEKLEKIKDIAECLFTHAISDPVRREKKILEIIKICEDKE